MVVLVFSWNIQFSVKWWVKGVVDLVRGYQKTEVLEILSIIRKIFTHVYSRFCVLSYDIRILQNGHGSVSHHFQYLTSP